jgi:hypothetical protein
VFIQLFGEGDTAEERAALLQQERSILDLISERTQELSGQLGASDRSILSNHLEAVREIERRVQKADAGNLKDVKLPIAPAGELESFDAQVKLMFDLVALAYQANLTRVASYIMVAEGTNRTYNHIGVPDAFHPLSHHANDADKIDRLVKIQRYHVERFAAFLDKLAAINEGEHEQQRSSQQLSASGDPRGRRRRQAEGRATRGPSAAHPARQPASHRAQQGWHRPGALCGQHRLDHAGLT